MQNELSQIHLVDLIGGQLFDDDYGQQWRPSALVDQLDNSTQFANRYFTVLPDYGVLQAAGPDSAGFLQGQLTNDIVKSASSSNLQLSGYCTPKGRLLASFWVAKHSDSLIDLVLSRGLAESVRKRLSMFVMRSKTKLLDQSSERTVLGFNARANDAGGQLALEKAVLIAQKLDPESRVWHFDEPDNGRALMIVSHTALAALIAELACFAQPVASDVWRYTEIQRGLARITPLTAELFVPQMVNFELVGGVNFKKGCYPGQEIVARSQYLGKLKRRSLLAYASSAPKAGSDVFIDGKDEPIGQVVMAADVPPQFSTDSIEHPTGAIVLFEASLPAIETAHIEGAATEAFLNAGGARLSLVPMPYSFPTM
jgi:tRNA-modifying protein YgfZ